MKCGVVGDTVNLASRVEQLTKVYRAPFLIGERTYLALEAPEAFSIRMVDRVAVKGKSQAIELYEVLDADSEERRAMKERTKALLAEALKNYFGRDFKLALELCLDGMAQDPLDPVFRIFQERSQCYIEAPPPEDWQGFEKLTSK